MDMFGDKANLIAIALVIGALAIFLKLAQRSSRQTSERIKSLRKPPEQMSMPSAHNLESPPSLAQFEVQMHDLSRDLMGQLDTKIAILNQLILTAERCIARLESTLADLHERGPARLAADRATAIDKAAERAVPPAVTLSTDDSRAKAVYALADAGFASATIASRLDSPLGEVEMLLSLRQNVSRPSPNH